MVQCHFFPSRARVSACVCVQTKQSIMNGSLRMQTTRVQRWKQLCGRNWTIQQFYYRTISGPNESRYSPGIIYSSRFTVLDNCRWRLKRSTIARSSTIFGVHSWQLCNVETMPSRAPSRVVVSSFVTAQLHHRMGLLQG